MRISRIQRTSISLIVVPGVATNTAQADEGGSWVQTPDQEQKVLFDFYIDEPDRINAALYRIRAQMNPRIDAPYNQAPEFMRTLVIIHDTEIVTVARKNYDRYKNAVERMRYYAGLGVEFKVCARAAEDYDYRVTDFYEFIDVVPSTITELVHWQQQDYSLYATRAG